MQEVAVVWAHREGTSINPLVDGSRMVMEMLHVRWNNLTGKYDADAAPSVKPAPSDPGPQA